jgi:hypothetical protein
MTFMTDPDEEEDDGRSNFKRVASGEDNPDESRLRIIHVCQKNSRTLYLSEYRVLSAGSG